MTKLYTPFEPHKPAPVEATFDKFVERCNGTHVSSLVGRSPGFENADYLFIEDQVLIELKSIESDWPMQAHFGEQIKALWLRYRILGEVSDNDLESDGKIPVHVRREFLNLLKKPLKRILKKANRQLRDTKVNLGRADDSGVVVLVIDGLLTVSPKYLLGLVAEILIHDYSSISAFVVLTLNEYVILRDDKVARLLWVPSYQDTAKDSLVDFIDSLGRKWFDFLEQEVGGIGDYATTEERSVLNGASFLTKPRVIGRIIT